MASSEKQVCNTIFLEVAKKIIAADLERIADEASAKDKITFYLWRDDTLSKSKQMIIKEFARKFEDLSSENFDSDQMAKEKMIHLINECKGKTEKMAGDKGYDGGSTSPSLTRTVTILTNLYQTFLYNNGKERDDIFKLLDRKSDAQPVNIMILKLMTYIGINYHNNRHFSGLVTRWLSKLKSFGTNEETSMNLLASEKICAVLVQIDNTIKNLARINLPSEEEQETSHKETVIDNLDLLVLANIKLCKKYSYGTTIPVYATLGLVRLTSYYTPSEGVLEEAIKLTKEAIDSTDHLENTNKLVATI